MIIANRTPRMLPLSSLLGLSSPHCCTSVPHAIPHARSRSTLSRCAPPSHCARPARRRTYALPHPRRRHLGHPRPPVRRPHVRPHSYFRSIDDTHADAPHDPRHDHESQARTLGRPGGTLSQGISKKDDQLGSEQEVHRGNTERTDTMVNRRPALRIPATCRM